MKHVAAFQGMSILERGWLSSNNVVLHGQGEGAVLIDSSHALHGEQTLALLDRTLAGEPLCRLVNTHLHSDHCGGNAAVQRQTGCRISVPPGLFQAALAWDEDALSYRATGQVCARFTPDDIIAPGEGVIVAGRRWQALAAPGHDPHSIILFDAAHGVLISADALWENGFGVVFPELDGEQGFADVARVLDLIESLGARWVVPGHGVPFDDITGALQRARRRLGAFQADPQRHAWHGMKVLVKYHLLEVRQEPWSDFVAWFTAAPMSEAIWARLGRPEGTLAAFAERTVSELVDKAVLARRDGWVLDA